MRSSTTCKPANRVKRAKGLPPSTKNGRRIGRTNVCVRHACSSYKSTPVACKNNLFTASKTSLFNTTWDETETRILETQLAAGSRLGSANSMVDTLYRLEFDMARH